MQYPDMEEEEIFLQFLVWSLFVVFLCFICECLRDVYNCMVRSPEPAPAPSPITNLRFATAAASMLLNSAASTSAAAAATSRPSNSASSTSDHSATCGASKTSIDHSAVPSVLRMLPDFEYSAAAQKQNLNCCVCLTDFKDGEKGRFLPRCFHCFHVECIDMWLASHSLCPVCRASIDPAAPLDLAV